MAEGPKVRLYNEYLSK